MQLSVPIEVFKEGDVYVALASHLNVSSFGDSIDDARESLKEAILAFLEECAEIGSLDQVLEESGFSRSEGSWQPRKPVLEESLALAV